LQPFWSHLQTPPWLEQRMLFTSCKVMRPRTPAGEVVPLFRSLEPFHVSKVIVKSVMELMRLYLS